MCTLIQHSFGKSDKVDKLISDRAASGIILSPKGETNPRKMIEVINNYITTSGFKVLFDPHFHLGLIENCPDAKIKDYPYYKPNLKTMDFSSPKKIISYVESVLNFEIQELHLSELISPACIIDSFESSLASILMAQTSIEYCKDNNIQNNMYISFVISENAFRGSKEALDDFITNITSIEELNRIYLVIDKNTEAYSQQMDTDVLKNILYFIYSLSNRNGIEIICGYTDLIGILFLSVGATAIATGWSQKSRYFSRNNYKEMSGGSQPKNRYTSIPLLNSIYNVPELQVITKLGYQNLVLSNTQYDEIIKNDVSSDEWSKNISYYHHVECLNILVQKLDEINNIDDRIVFMEQKIKEANDMYENLISKGVQFHQYNNNTHLKQWSEALQNLKAMIG